MENNYETLRMPELKALTREHKLRGYSRLRKAELIAFLQKDEEDRRQEEPPTQEPALEVPQPFNKRQLKHRRLENEIVKAAQSTNAGFKRKKIRSMKRDVIKAIEKLKESEKSFKLIESRMIPKNNKSKQSSSK